METSSREANSKATCDGRYWYDRGLLGCGAFGTVLKARDSHRNDELVAIKIVKAQRSIKQFLSRKTPSAVKGTRKEAELLVRLQHENIIGIRDHYEFKSGRTVGLAIVMDYCPGGNLQGRLELLCNEDQRLDKPQRLQWYGQLAAGLQYIHSQEVVHRDLKPPNILIDADDNLKIADVGMAKALHDVNANNEVAADDCSYLTYMQTVAGSPAYMAPEVWQQHYRASSDVFSMGLIMLTLCEVPNPPIPVAQFENQSKILGVLMYLEEGARSETPSDLLGVQNCPTDELELFNSMLQYNYNERPSMDVVVEKLEEIEEQQYRQSQDKETRPNRNQSSCVLL